MNIDLKYVPEGIWRKIASNDISVFDEFRPESPEWAMTVRLKNGDTHNFTPFILASYFGATDIVKGLLAKKRETPFNRSSSFVDSFKQTFSAQDDEEYQFPDVVKGIANSDNLALRYAADNGHLEVVKLLLAKNSNGSYRFPKVVNEIATIDNYALRWATQNGHLDIVKLLLAKNPDGSYQFPDVVAAITARDNLAFRYTAANGHLEIVKLLLGKNPDGSYQFPAVVDKVAAENNHALRYAAKFGHPEVVKLLLAQDSNRSYQFPDVVNEIATIDNDALRWAAENGHLEVVKLLLAKNPDGSYQFPAVVRQIATGNNDALCWATRNGHLEVVKLLLAKNPDGSYQFSEVVNNIAIHTNYALRSAAENGHIEIVKLLLCFEPVFSYAEQHLREYGARYVTPFVQDYLQENQRNAVNSLSEQKASFACAVLRYLVRTAAPIEQINLLLSIPEVSALVHRNNNEVLQLAMRLNNHAATSRLMQIPQVAQDARLNEFYALDRAHALGLTLQDLVNNNESSMVALSAAEQEQYENIVNRYWPTLREQGTPQILNKLRAHLKTEYVNSSSMPFEWEDLQALRENEGWTDQTYQTQLQQYYQNRFHTAYRLLLKPNPWIDPNASYVEVDGNNTQQRSANLNDLETMIALFWLAASDTTEGTMDGINTAGRISAFITELAAINRRHNYDHYRTNSTTQKREQYDDLQGDKPSCYSGMKRAIFQSLVQHSALQSHRYVPEVVLEDAVRNTVWEFYQHYFAGKNKEQLTQLRDEMTTYCANLEPVPLIADLSNDVIEKLIRDLNQKYPNKIVSGYDSFADYVKKALDTSATGNSHFLKFYQSYGLDEALNTALKKVSPAPHPT